MTIAVPKFLVGEEKDAKLEVVYALDDVTQVGPSIFLAGPTSRDSHTGRATAEFQGVPITPWRKETLDLLQEFHFEGAVYVPEYAKEPVKFDQQSQLGWEWRALHAATVVAFWVPRTSAMPGLTTNLEFGAMLAEGRPTVLGFPPYAESTGWMEWHAARADIPIVRSIGALVHRSIVLVQDVLREKASDRAFAPVR